VVSAPGGPSVDDAIFLVNPASANGATARRWPKLRQHAHELGLSGEERLSERPGHLTDLARAAAGEGRLIVVVGGDGTLNEVANGLAGTGAEIAILPNGTGQDFGRTHGIPTKFDEAVEVALTGTARAADAGRATFGDGSVRIFANVGSVGMSGAVARRANSMSKAFGGRTTFYYALTREFVAWKNTEVVVASDAGERRGRMHDVIVANGRWHGGGMKLAPDAEFDDGLFDVVLIGDITKLDFITTSPKLYSGGYVEHPRVDVMRTASLDVSAAEPLPVELDGEVSGETPVRFEVIPAALRVRAPG
jgi:YegS/Rv2252/BmrU family lipid kinase